MGVWNWVKSLWENQKPLITIGVTMLIDKAADDLKDDAKKELDKVGIKLTEDQIAIVLKAVASMINGYIKKRI